jgi:hypothetical protein
MDAAQKIDWGEQEFTEVRPNIHGATIHFITGHVLYIDGGRTII